MKQLMIGLGLAAASASAVAQPDLQQVYEAARNSDPEYLAAVAQRDAQLQLMPQARAKLLPNANLSAEYGRSDRRIYEASSPFAEDEIFNSTQARLEIRQPVFRWDAFAGYGAAKVGAAQTEVGLLLAEQDLLLRAAEAYFTYLSAQAELRFAQSEHRATEKQLEQNRQRHEVGLIAITDVQETQARFDLAGAQLISAQQDVANAADTLAQIMGARQDGLPDLQSNIPLENPQPADVEQWVKTGEENNLRMMRARLAEEVAGRQVSAARGAYLPTLDAVASSGYSDTSETNFGSEGIEHRLSLQLNLPLFAGGSNRSKVLQRLSEQEQSLQQLEQTRREVEREVRAAYRGTLSAIKRVLAFRQAVKSNRMALSATEAGYEVGNRTPVDVLNARSSLFLAQRDYANARYEYVLQRLRLLLSAGTLTFEDLLTVNGWLEGSLAQ